MRATLHRYLLERPAGATARELLDLVFTQPGANAEFGPRFIRTLLSGDPRFSYRDSDQHWFASAHAVLTAPLAVTEFVVVDLETTGGSAERGDAIIEIGAVRIDADRRTHHFNRLVNPRRRLPAFISGLTGITDRMLTDQPTIAEVLPEFLAFVGDRVLVAHNARFDVSFLNVAAHTLLGQPLHQPSLCTLRLARRLVPTLRRRGLDAVAAHFGIALVDRHRALGDARITTEIFFRFLDLLAARGITRLDQVLALQTSARDGRLFVCPLPRAAVTALPETPGVYRFFGADGHLLYIGKAKNLRQRVGQYLSNTNGHSNKTLDLIRHIHAVRATATGSELAAALDEADAIRAEQPPYNRLRKHLPRIAFIRLTADREFPRLVITSRPPAGRRRSGRYFGPFRSREAAQRVLDLVTRRFKLRTCAGRLRPAIAATPCWRGQIDSCSAPCAAGITASQYAHQVVDFLALMAGDRDAPRAQRSSTSGRHTPMRCASKPPPGRSGISYNWTTSFAANAPSVGWSDSITSSSCSRVYTRARRLRIWC
ncbi:MAG TPA: exonuclease domain-containing protein [Candidatus Kryptonia bacterium]|nr:exonuclease domain-containing protein [Candidatus Kryptonia bacterium]